MRKDIYELIIDREFKTLIRPLTADEFRILETNIKEEGCREAIITWNKTIIDGHNRFEICTKNAIPFRIHEMDFESREDAIKWICLNQLGRRNLTEETKKFLIGKQYESEKIINNRKNKVGYNQYKKADKKVPYGRIVADVEKTPALSSHKTAMRIAEENNISESTVQKYGVYSRALDEIEKKSPQIIPKILSGRYKISYNNIIELSQLSKEDIDRIFESIDDKEKSFIPYGKSRREFESNETRFKAERLSGATIKDMPTFDPDAEISSLRFTVPSWTSSIERVINKTDFVLASENAKETLVTVLLDLENKIRDLISNLKEK